MTLAGNYPILGEDREIVLPEGEDILISRAGLIYVDGQPVTKKIAVFKKFPRNANTRNSQWINVYHDKRNRNT